MNWPSNLFSDVRKTIKCVHFCSRGVAAVLGRTPEHFIAASSGTYSQRLPQLRNAHRNEISIFGIRLEVANMKAEWCWNMVEMYVEWFLSIFTSWYGILFGSMCLLLENLSFTFALPLCKIKGNRVGDPALSATGTGSLPGGRRICSTMWSPHPLLHMGCPPLCSNDTRSGEGFGCNGCCLAHESIETCHTLPDAIYAPGSFLGFALCILQKRSGSY